MAKLTREEVQKKLRGITPERRRELIEELAETASDQERRLFFSILEKYGTGGADSGQDATEKKGTSWVDDLLT